MASRVKTAKKSCSWLGKTKSPPPNHSMFAVRRGKSSVLQNSGFNRCFGSVIKMRGR